MMKKLCYKELTQTIGVFKLKPVVMSIITKAHFTKVTWMQYKNVMHPSQEANHITVGLIVVVNEYFFSQVSYKYDIAIRSVSLIRYVIRINSAYHCLRNFTS